jgi:hypothetical protein
MAKLVNGSPFLFDEVTGAIVGTRNQNASSYRDTTPDIYITVEGSKAATDLQAALDAVKLLARRSARVKVISEGSITLVSGITIDPYYHNVDFGGAVVTYTPTTGVAITVQGTAVSAYTQLVGGVSNINLSGPLTGTSTGILYTGVGVAGIRTSSANYNVTTNGFYIGVDFYDYAYLTHFYGLVINGFTGIGLRQRVGADAGETIGIHGGCISNGTGVAIQTIDDTSEILLYGVSLDYNTTVLDIQSGRVVMHDGHIEFNGGTAVNDQIKIDNQGSFTMIGGCFVVNTSAGAGPYAYSYMVNVVNANSYAMFDNVLMTNHRNTDDLWATGPGTVKCVNTRYYSVTTMPYAMHSNNNLLADGAGENTIGQDFWYIQYDQNGTYPSRMVGGSGLAITRDTGTKRSGASSVRLRRGPVGATYVQACSIAIPVSGFGGRRMHANLWAYSDMGAATYMSLLWCSLQKLDASDRPVWYRESAYATNFYNSEIPAAWTKIGINNGTMIVPRWATHLQLKFDLSAGASSASVWVDDFSVEVV